ncbi:hypothetical protein BKA93DRAFT_898475 [Sparassis latifolia]
MLSAVAARKARLQGPATTQPVAVIPTPTSPPAPSLTPVSEPRIVPKLQSKRKTAVQVEKPPSKKKKHAHTAESDRRTRYFEQPDVFKQQGDANLVDDDHADEDTDTAWSPSAPDSSDDEEDGVVEGNALPSLVPILAEHLRAVSHDAPSVLSTFKPAWEENIFRLSQSEVHDLSLPSYSEQTGTLLLLTAEETVTLLGTYSLTVLRGCISFAGVVLTPSRVSHRVFAPRSSPLPVIKCLALKVPLRDLSLPARLRTTATSMDAAVLLQELHTGVQGLGAVCRTFDGVFSPSRSQSNVSAFDLNLRGVHLVRHCTHDISVLVIPPSWETAMSPILQPAAQTDYSRRVYLVKGPQNSGKSVFARTLLNRLLTLYRRVAFLECDLGQSEFVPGGMVAVNVVDKPVFGPPFTHPSVPHSAHYIGAATPRNSPSHYLDSVQALIQTYNVHLQHAGLVDDTSQGVSSDEDRIVDLIPLVVNTMGWTKGLGADLSRRVEEITDPSDIFELGTYLLEPVPSTVLSHRYTPADNRTLSMLSYFYAVFPVKSDASALQNCTAMSWRTSLPLCAQPPYEVDWKSAFDRTFLTGAGTEDVVPTEIHRVLNGAIVAMVSCEPDTLDTETDDMTAAWSTSPPYKQDAAPPTPFGSSCAGLALVRSLSPVPASVLHLLTPLPPHALSRVRVLVKGELELPVWGMLDFRAGDGGEIAGVESGKVPYLRWGKGEGTGGDRRRVRRNLMRRGQM